MVDFLQSKELYTSSLVEWSNTMPGWRKMLQKEQMVNKAVLVVMATLSVAVVQEVVLIQVVLVMDLFNKMMAR